MNSAIDYYHDLLTPDVAEASHAMLEDQLRRRGLVFGDRPLCTVLRPRFISPEHLRLLEQRVARLMPAFAKAQSAALADSRLRQQLRLADWEEELLADDPGFEPASPTSRLDLFVMDDAGTMALTEYNAETPAGAGFNDALVAAFSDIPVIQQFSRKYSIRPLPARHGVGHTLLAAWRAFSRSWRAPRIAIVDWEDVPTRNEFVLFKEYFGGLGLSCEIVSPQALTYQGGRLSGLTGPIDLVYKRVLIHELIQEGGLQQPLVQAVRERAVCMVNPFRCKLLHKKASLALLSDERNADLFGKSERAAIDEFIPWTRVVEERKTRHTGRTVDLIPYLAERRDRFVLKPNDDYGGAGIVLGWTVSDTEWQAAVQRAIAQPYVVQERVPIPSEPYPSMVDGALHVVDRMLDTAPFVCFGDYMEGMLTRLSTAELLNVTAGGGSTVPAFVVDSR